MFGFKKKTVDEILSAIEKLSDEDRKMLIASLAGETQTDDPPESDSSTDEIPPTAEEPAEEQTQTESEANTEPQQPEAENAENAPATDGASELSQPLGMSEEQPQDGIETAENGMEAEVQEEPVPNILPENTPTDTVQAQNPADNSQELFAAQNAKIEALESQIAAIQEMLENIVSAADRQNFGSSPEGDFDDEEHSSQYSTILQSYAGRRAKDYQ